MNELDFVMVHHSSMIYTTQLALRALKVGGKVIHSRLNYLGNANTQYCFIRATFDTSLVW